MHKYDTIIIMGRSGSGKGTQIELLKKNLQEHTAEQEIFSFDSGDSFRGFTKKEGYSQKLIREQMNSGNLIPDIVTNWMFVNSLVESLREDQIILLDGFPRTVDQAKTLTQALEYYKHKHVAVINIEVSEEEVRNRLIERGRGDDREQVIETRLAWYRENVLPTLDYLQGLDNYEVLNINGEQSPKEVQSDLLSLIISENN